MVRHCRSWMIWGALVLCAVASSGRAAPLIPQSHAIRCGLKRAWFAQVGSLQTTGPVNHVRYSGGLLLVQTVGGILTGLDAETGRTLWAVQVGPRGRQTTEAAANNGYVAVVNGSTLYVLDRSNGAVLWNRRLGGAPGAGPAVSDTHVFVPMVDGKIEGYAVVGGEKGSPWVYKSAGRVLVPPMATAQSVSWTTEQGYFYVADPAAQGIRYRLETSKAIHARPGHWTPNLYAGSIDGSVYGVDEVSGRMLWKFAIGDAIYEPPVAVQDKVFTVSQFRGMTCLDVDGPTELWVAPGIKQFLSASPTRLYTRDSLGRLVVLDLETGTRLASLPLVDVILTLTNRHSDRVYLVSATGAVQCLHEVGRRTPVLHVPPAPEKTDRNVELRDRSDEPTESPLPADDVGDPDTPTEDDADDPFSSPS
jgi:outer membrane protein assembly factor BamB